MKSYKKITIICPVRNGTPTEIFDYVAELESKNYCVHFPLRDNPQQDSIGYYICAVMLEAIRNCDEVHVFYSSESQGCHFDLGMCFALGKRVVIKNPEIDNSLEKSYIKVFNSDSYIKTQEGKILSGWGHPYKAKSQHYFVRNFNGLYISVCGIWQMPLGGYELVNIYPEPMSTSDDLYLQYPICGKCIAKRN